MKMKSVLFTCALAFSLCATQAQSIFDALENNDAVSSILVNKSMFMMLSKFEAALDTEPEAKQFVEMAKNIQSLKVFTTSDKQVTVQMEKMVTKYVAQNKLTELMRARDKEGHVRFYIRPGATDDKVKELLMFVDQLSGQGQINGRKVENVLLTIVGDIDLNKISGLIAKMNLPKELNRVSKK
jgi:hypothetical protein